MICEKTWEINLAKKKNQKKILRSLFTQVFDAILIAVFVFSKPARREKRVITIVLHAVNLSLPSFYNVLDDGCDIVNRLADHVEAYVLTDITEVLRISTVIVPSGARSSMKTCDVW